MDNNPHVVGKFTLHHDHSDQLVLIDETGQRYVGVEVVRAFPLSDPQHAISVFDRDGREIAFLDSLDSLPAETRLTLETALSQREFVPTIRRILNRPPNTEPTEWMVETDRGVTTFQLESETDIHLSGSQQVTIVDSHGIHYLIPDRHRLDAHSRRVLDGFL
jgi:hypothetical protein